MAAWTGTEVLVVGGSENLCPPGADCAMTEPLLVDGAAYSPDNNSWRPISPSPLPVVGSPVVGDDVVYFETVSNAGSMARSDAIAGYQPSTDTWLTIIPSGLAGAELEAVFKGQLVLHDRGNDHLVLVSPVDGSTRQLPAPPTPPMHSTQVTVVGELLYLFGNERQAEPDSSNPSLRLAAVYDDLGGWQRMPDSETLGGDQMLKVEGQLIDSSDGSADGGQVNNWGRSYPYGGAFDMASERWESLPGGRPTGAWALPRAVAAGAGIVTTDALWLDPKARAWTTIPSPNVPNDGAIAWAGDRLFVWGGSSWTDSQGELHNEGATYALPQ